MASCSRDDDDGDDMVSNTSTESRDEINKSRSGSDSDPSKKCKVLLVGTIGSGKSTLVNSFIGEERAEVGDGPRSQTKKPVQVHSVNFNDVRIDFYDTMGLCNPEIKDNKLLKTINKNCPEGFDVALICVRMDQRIDRGLIDALLEISNVYGSNFWERAVFVLTFANMYALYPNVQGQDGEVTAKNMSRYVEKFSEYLHTKMVDEANWLYAIKESIYTKIPFCMAGLCSSGDKEGRMLPTSQDWVNDLFVACVAQSNNDSVRGSLVDLATRRVLVETGTVGGTAVVGGGAGAFIGGAIGTIFFPGVGTVIGAGVGALIGGGIGGGAGATAGGGGVVGVRAVENLIKKRLRRNSSDDCQS